MLDEELRTVFRHILDSDAKCPLSERAKRYGSDDPAVAFVMAGYLVATVHLESGEIIRAADAVRIVTEEFTLRGKRP